jgi:hypothetical protein
MGLFFRSKGHIAQDFSVSVRTMEGGLATIAIGLDYRRGSAPEAEADIAAANEVVRSYLRYRFSGSREQSLKSLNRVGRDRTELMEQDLPFDFADRTLDRRDGSQAFHIARVRRLAIT